MPDTAPPSSSTDTRARLLDAAARLFAAHGYDGVSTRALARAAGVNVAAIGYHFGGKKELYTAVIHHAVEATNSIAIPVAEGLRSGIAAANGDRRLLARRRPTGSSAAWSMDSVPTHRCASGSP